MALTDSNGNIGPQYTYDPFGSTSQSGTSTNTFQFTGRENDGTGLYYLRARYYSPALQRFISQDPIGFAGGINLYAYAGNNPVSLIDPLGTDPSGQAAAAAAVAGVFVFAAVMSGGLALLPLLAEGAVEVSLAEGGVEALGTLRGISQFGGIVSSVTNAAGGTVVTAEGAVERVNGSAPLAKSRLHLSEARRHVRRVGASNLSHASGRH